jgi:hypothetical protein
VLSATKKACVIGIYFFFVLLLFIHYYTLCRFVLFLYCDHKKEIPWMVEITVLEASPVLCTALYLQLPLAYAKQLEILVGSKSNDMAITAIIPVDRVAGQLEGTVGKYTREEHRTA